MRVGIGAGSWRVVEERRTVLVVDNDDRVVMGPGIETQIIPRIDFLPQRKLEETVPINSMIDTMIQRRRMNRILFQRYRVLQVIDFHRFRILHGDVAPPWTSFPGIASLDISFSRYVEFVDRDVDAAVYYYMVLFLPELRSINISHVCVNPTVLSRITKTCPQLESITWNWLWLNSLIGAEMKDLHHLKELYMDGCVFNTYRYALDIPIPFDTDGIPNNFFLCQCNQSLLERVSVKNSPPILGERASYADRSRSSAFATNDVNEIHSSRTAELNMVPQRPLLRKY